MLPRAFCGSSRAFLEGPAVDHCSSCFAPGLGWPTPGYDLRHILLPFSPALLQRKAKAPCQSAERGTCWVLCLQLCLLHTKEIQHHFKSTRSLQSKRLPSLAQQRMALLMVYHPTAHKGEETSCFRHPQRPEQKLAIPHRAQHSMALLMVYEPAAMPGRSPGCFMCVSFLQLPGVRRRKLQKQQTSLTPPNLSHAEKLVRSPGQVRTSCSQRLESRQMQPTQHFIND